ncbi:MAG TPA: hypothetical protein VF789_25185 [Thermoanaerobaculia bacterium]
MSDEIKNETQPALTVETKSESNENDPTCCTSPPSTDPPPPKG